MERKPRKLPVAISEDEFTELIKHTNMEHHKLAFLLGFGSGLRVSEILNLTPERVDMKEKSIFVSQGKGKKDRIVPLPKGFKDKYLALLPFKIRTTRALEMVFRRTAINAGLTKVKPDIHFHSLRHGFASQLIKKGVPIHHVRTLLGHSNISTTNVYLELNPKEALKSYEDLF